MTMLYPNPCYNKVCYHKCIISKPMLQQGVLSWLCYIQIPVTTRCVIINVLYPNPCYNKVCYHDCIISKPMLQRGVLSWLYYIQTHVTTRCVIMTVLYPNPCYNEVCYHDLSMLQRGVLSWLIHVTTRCVIMTMLYPNPCYKEVCYQGTALYMHKCRFHLPKISSREYSTLCCKQPYSPWQADFCLLGPRQRFPPNILSCIMARFLCLLPFPQGLLHSVQALHSPISQSLAEK